MEIKGIDTRISRIWLGEDGIIRSTPIIPEFEMNGSDAENIVSACALIVESIISRVIGNFFIGLNKASIPFRLFTNEAEALGWLKQYTTNQENDE